MNTPTRVEVKDICHEFGVSFATAKNQIYLDRFPVPTYKVGKKIVVDRVVLDLYREQVRSFQIERFRCSTQPK